MYINMISHRQIPNGLILNLVDEDDKQLYSPYDTNGNPIKTRCTVTIGEENILPLPANYINDNEYIDFDVGIYNWQLKFFGNNYFYPYTIPFVVEIHDFELFEVLNPEIFPNEDLFIKFLTPIETPLEDDDIINLDEFGLINSSNGNGIVRINNDSLTDTTVGQHSEVFNQEKNYVINYTIKNPLIYRAYPNETEYSNLITVETMITQESSIDFDLETYMTINDTYYPLTARSGSMKADTILLNDMPPGTYNVTSIAELTDGHEYIGNFSFTVTTNKCSINLTSTNNVLSEQNPSVTLTSNYLYNSTGIHNATMALVDVDTNTIINTQQTNNGIINWAVSTAGLYKIVATDYDGTWLLSSDVIIVRDDESENYVQDMDINNQANLLITMNRTEHPENENLVNTISMNNGNLILTIDTGSTNSTKDIYIDKNGNLKYE